MTSLPTLTTGCLSCERCWLDQPADLAVAAGARRDHSYLAVTLRQRISRRMAEGTQLGMALEGLTAADLAQHQG